MKLIQQALDNNQIALNEQQIAKLEAYLHQLNHWNKAYNLTAITDPSEQIYKHIIDSLSVRDFIVSKRVCDVGTGAGLPGIPLAIALADKQFTLLDSSQKRIIFIQQTLAKLNVPNVIPHQGRVEEFNTETKFDTIISRAFSSLRDFIEKTRHLVAQEGQLLAMKGAYPTEELHHIPQDFFIADVRELVISGLDAKRHVVIIKKR